MTGIKAGNSIFWNWSNGTSGRSTYTPGGGRIETYDNPSWRSNRTYYTPSYTPRYTPSYTPSYTPRYAPRSYRPYRYGD